MVKREANRREGDDIDETTSSPSRRDETFNNDDIIPTSRATHPSSIYDAARRDLSPTEPLAVLSSPFVTLH